VDDNTLTTDPQPLSRYSCVEFPTLRMRFLFGLTLVGVFLTSSVAHAQTAVDPKILLLPGYTLDASATGDIFGDGSQAIAMLSHPSRVDGMPTDGRADLFTSDCADATCAPALSVPLPYFESGGLFLAPLTGNGRQQLVVYTVSGSGGFLSYQVFGSVDGQWLQLLERYGIFQGKVEQRVDGLLESSTDRSRLYRWNGAEFVGSDVDVSRPVPIGTAKLHYTVTSAAVLGPKEVALKVGQQLEPVRDDDGSDNTRILYGTDLFAIQQWPVLKAIKPGKSSILIIPHGYDSDNALEVTIVVSP
jgi:hypothetical protein